MTTESYAVRVQAPDSMLRRLRMAGGGTAALLVAAVALFTWLASGVSASEIVRYLAFEGLFVLMPGCLLCALLLDRNAGWLLIVTIGWPLGHAIEIGAFALTAALGERGLLVLLAPLSLAILAALAIHRHGVSPRAVLRRALAAVTNAASTADPDATGAADSAATPDRAARLIAGLIVGVALLVIALEFFGRFPLPGRVSSVVYFPDNVFDISIAAQALHHWPITTPWVAGQPLRYYTGFFIHVAAVNQVAGVPLATTVLRLFPTTATALICLQLWTLGRQLGRSGWTGVLSLALFFPVNTLSLDPAKFEDVGITPFFYLTISPTFALGTSFFLGLLLLLQRQFAIDGRPPAARASPPPAEACTAARAAAASRTVGSLLITAALVLACTATKTAGTLVFLAGIGLFWFLRVLRARDNRLLPYLAVSAVCAAAVFHLLITGGVSRWSIRPFNFVHFTLFFSVFPARSALSLLLLMCASALIFVFLVVSSWGALWTLRLPERENLFVGLSASLFATSAIAFFAVEAAADAQVEFLNFGWIAIIPITALGLTRLWQQTPRTLRRRILRAAGIVLALGAALAVSMRLVILADVHLGWRRIDNVSWQLMLWYILAYSIVALGIAYFTVRLEKGYMETIHSRAARMFACVLLLVIPLTLVKSVGSEMPEALNAVASTQVSTDSNEHPGMTSALYEGLVWVRNHTNRCAILAANTHSRANGEIDAKYFYYSAFTERSVYLESWAFTPLGAYGAQPYPARYELNYRAVKLGEATALRELARQGVSYVLVDELHGGGAVEPAALSTLVFSDSALDVYRLRGSPAARAGRSRCS
jgi:hypothetical protein